MTLIKGLTIGLLLMVAALMIGCGGSSNPPTSSLNNFQPEIINNPDAFQFQVTNATNVSTVRNYTWSNSGTQATINHSTVTDSGSAAITIYDADGTQVYSNGLAASLTDQSSAGTSGNWIIQVSFTGFYGTANFRVEKL